jgi:hypothetical protein
MRKWHNKKTTSPSAVIPARLADRDRRGRSNAVLVSQIAWSLTVVQSNVGVILPCVENFT